MMNIVMYVFVEIHNTYFKDKFLEIKLPGKRIWTFLWLDYLLQNFSPGR